VPSREGLPFVVKTAKEKIICDALERVPLTRTPSEAWLQEVLDRSPDLLPMRDIDERVETPLLSLGREISTPAGSIDNLFLSRNGYLVVVETKLWRNPEARRQVVAQLIDYAAHLRKWRYSDLDGIVRARAGKSLWELAQPEGLDEPEWIDRVNENFARGRMTLLVVGDGIRTEAETLAETVSGHPDFHFRLALVEMRLFRVDEESYLIVPATLIKTTEIERAVVRVERGVVTVETSSEISGVRRSVLSEDALRDELRRQPDGEVAAQVAVRLLELLGPPLQVSWGSGGFAVKMPDPEGSGRLLSLCVVGRPGILWAWISWLQDQLVDLWRDQDTVKRVSEAHVAVLRKYGAKVSPTGKQYDVKLTALAGREQEFVADLLELASLIERTASDRAK